LEQKIIWDNRYSSIKHNSQSSEWVEKYREYFREKKERTIIDLGCGKGDNSYHLTEAGYSNIIACDFSPVAIEYINKTYPTIETRCFDMINEFPGDIKNVGVVLASLSTHYFSMNDTVKLYRNIYDILEPTGYFIFRVNGKKEFENNDKNNIHSVIENDYYLLNDGTTKRYFDIDSISALLKSFLIVDVHETDSKYHGQTKYYIEGIAQKV